MKEVLILLVIFIVMIILIIDSKRDSDFQKDCNHDWKLKSVKFKETTTENGWDRSYIFTCRYKCNKCGLVKKQALESLHNIKSERN